MAVLKRLLLLLAACGVPGGDSGGGEHLPSAGAGPFAKPEDPFVRAEVGFDLEDPALRPGSDEIFYTRRAAIDGALPAIYAVGSTGEPRLVREAARSPSLLEEADGGLVLYFETLEGDVARAHSNDDGVTWQDDGVVLADALDPGVIVVDGTTYLYFGVPDGRSIGVATSGDGLVFARASGPVLTVTPGFAAAAIGQPCPVGGTTATGRLHIVLFHSGQSLGGQWAIGAAGSFDGLGFERFANGEAVLEPEAEDERGPAVRLTDEGATLFYVQRRIVNQALAHALTE